MEGTCPTANVDIKREGGEEGEWRTKVSERPVELERLFCKATFRILFPYVTTSV